MQIAFNLSARNLMDSACPAALSRLVDKYQVARGALIADPDRAYAILRQANAGGNIRQMAEQ